MDMDSRPHLNFEGVVSLRNRGIWTTICEKIWTKEKMENTAMNICSYLGFRLFHIKLKVTYKYYILAIVKTSMLFVFIVKFWNTRIPSSFPTLCIIIEVHER